MSIPTVNGWKPDFLQTAHKRWAAGEPVDHSQLKMTDEVLVPVNGRKVWMEILDPPQPELVRCFSQDFGIREFNRSQIERVRGTVSLRDEAQRLKVWWCRLTDTQRQIEHDMSEG